MRQKKVLRVLEVLQVLSVLPVLSEPRLDDAPMEPRGFSPGGPVA